MIALTIHGECFIVSFNSGETEGLHDQASGGFNYNCFMSRYGTAYWLEMCELSETHPWLYRQIQESPGCWTVQRQGETGFSSLAADQTIEVTVNRESKTSGGIKGITLTRGNIKYNSFHKIQHYM